VSSQNQQEPITNAFVYMSAADQINNMFCNMYASLVLLSRPSMCICISLLPRFSTMLFIFINVEMLAYR